jgi:hypothetical protein
MRGIRAAGACPGAWLVLLTTGLRAGINALGFAVGIPLYFAQMPAAGIGGLAAAALALGAAAAGEILANAVIVTRLPQRPWRFMFSGYAAIGAGVALVGLAQATLPPPLVVPAVILLALLIGVGNAIAGLLMPTFFGTRLTAGDFAAVLRLRLILVTGAATLTTALGPWLFPGFGVAGVAVAGGAALVAAAISAGVAGEPEPRPESAPSPYSRSMTSRIDGKNSGRTEPRSAFNRPPRPSHEVHGQSCPLGGQSDAIPAASAGRRLRCRLRRPGTDARGLGRRIFRAAILPSRGRCLRRLTAVAVQLDHLFGRPLLLDIAGLGIAEPEDGDPRLLVEPENGAQIGLPRRFGRRRSRPHGTAACGTVELTDGPCQSCDLHREPQTPFYVLYNKSRPEVCPDHDDRTFTRASTRVHMSHFY